MENIIDLLSRIKERSSAGCCATCRHPERVHPIVVDGDNIDLYCWNIHAFVRPMTRCDEHSPNFSGGD